MKLKYLLVAVAVMGTTLPSIGFTKSATPASHQVDTVKQEAYEADFEKFQEIIMFVDMDAISEVPIDGRDVEDKALQGAIDTMTTVLQATQKTNFTTAEGQQVKRDFIAFNEFSIKTFKNYNKWKDSERLEKEYSEQMMKHHENILKSLQKLSELAGNEY